MDKIYLDDVSFVYNPGTPFEKRALEHVTLGIAGGEITGIIGHTGSGKSTMMQLLNGLLTPTAGKIFLDGYNIHSKAEDLYKEWAELPDYRDLSHREAKKAIRTEVEKRKSNLCFRVGLVMQYPEYQLFEDTVRADIAFGPKNMGLDENEIDARVAEAAKFTGITPDLLDKSPFDLSGGQKRRVALAGVIAMRPEVLVLDEPAAGLDPRGRNTIFEGIVRFQKTTGSTVLIVSHSMEDMAKYCDHIAVLSGSRLLFSGDREEVFSHTRELAENGLDIPQITRLCEQLRERGLEIPQNLYTVEAAAEALRALWMKGGR